MLPNDEVGPSGRPIAEGLDVAGLALGLMGVALAALPATPAAMLGGGLYLLGITIRPWVAVPVVIMTLPFYLHPRSLAGVEISLTEMAVLLGTVVITLRSLVARGLLSRRELGEATASPRAIGPATVDWAVAAFLLAALLSLLVTEYPKQSLRELRWLVLEPILLF